MNLAVQIRSCSGGRRRPNVIGLRTEVAKRGSAYQVSLEVKGVVDRGVGGEKPLR